MKNSDLTTSYQICRAHREKGTILIFSLCLLLIMAIVGSNLLWIGLCSRTKTLRSNSRFEARLAADAAHELAYFKLKKMISSGGTTLPQQSTVVTLPASSTQKYKFTIAKAADGGYDVTATGYSINSNKTIKSRAYRTGGSTPYGLCVTNDVYFHAGYVDAYDSSKGVYGTGNKDLPLTYRTNGYTSGMFYMGQLASTPAGGSFIVGPQAAANPSIVKTGQGIFSGTYSAADAPMEFPAVPYSTTGLTNKGTLASGTITAGTYLYDRIMINQQTVTISGNVTLYLAQSSQITQGGLQIANDGKSSLTIYINGGQFLITQGIMNSITKNPKLLKIYGTNNCTQVKFDQNPDFHGMIYAPNAELQLNIGNLHGAFMGRRAYIDQAKVHYDKALINESMLPSSSGTDLVCKRWQEL